MPHAASTLYQAGIYTPIALTTGPTTAMLTHMELWCASGSIKPAQRPAKIRSLSFAYFDYGVIEGCLVVVLQGHAS